MLDATARAARTPPRTSAWPASSAPRACSPRPPACAAQELDVAHIPRPANAELADWLTCFPGFAMVTAGEARTNRAADPPPAAAER